MKRSLSNLLFLSIVLCSNVLLAQELNCRVQVNAVKIETTDRKIFVKMEEEFAKFMNETKWTDDRFENEERITCGLNITLESQPAIGSFKATVQVIGARPIYNSTYESVLINFADRDFDFDYTESQPFDFNSNTFITNITSLMGYYAYMIIAADYDSFESLGGQPYYEKAWEVVNNAQQSNYGGWDQFNSVRNRYWLAENMLNTISEPMRKALYSYHLNGLDVMIDRPEEARKNILEVLKVVQQVNRSRPRSIIVISFLDAKMDEIVSVMSKGNISLRREAYNILKQIDPSRLDEFKAILEN